MVELRTRFFFRIILPDQIIHNLFERTLVPLIFLAAFLVPVSIIVANFFIHRDKIGKALRTEYPRIISVTLYSWSVSHLVIGIPALLIFNPESSYYTSALTFAPLPYFGLLMILAMRSVYNLTLSRAVITVLIATVALPTLLFRSLFLLSTVPIFVLFWLVILMRGYVSEAMATRRARVRFEQSLVTATLNPVDSSAHYNLGRIYQQRGQITEAIDCFKQSIAISSEELDAHYQLGIIAREQNRFNDAILSFDAVVQRDLNFSQNEIWREIGATYYEAGQFEDAKTALERFLAARSSDAEGMYRYGLTLYELGRREDSFVQMREVIESVKKAPSYKYRTDRRWMIEAKDF